MPDRQHGCIFLVFLRVQGARLQDALCHLMHGPLFVRVKARRPARVDGVDILLRQPRLQPGLLMCETLERTVPVVRDHQNGHLLSAPGEVQMVTDRAAEDLEGVTERLTVHQIAGGPIR